VAEYGFMQVPNVPKILHLCEAEGLRGASRDASYYLGRVTVLNTGKSKMSRWRESLFSLLYRNARPATSFFRIPPNRVIELGIQIEL
jgi:KUP system potassium uptake protein